MSLKTGNLTDIRTNENLNRRPKKVNLTNKVVAKRQPLNELVDNKLKVPENNYKTNKAQNVDIKKPITKVEPIKTKTTITKTITQIKSQTVIHVKEEKVVVQEQIVDVDLKDKGNHYLVPEYVKDIFAYLRGHEEKFIVNKGYLSSHHSTSHMRSVLVNWMIEVHINFSLMLETLHLSVAILDRYLQVNQKIGKETLQLVGISALVIACKYEEMYMPPLADFAEISDNCFGCEDIKKMEVDILKKLQFSFGRPLSLHFLRRYNKIANVLPEHHNLAKYLLEIFLLQYELCHIKPSLQAASACCLSISILNEVSDPRKVWTKTLVQNSSYKYSEIKPTIVKLAYYLFKMDKSKFKSIQNKYATSSYGSISLNSKLRGPLVKKLIDEDQQKFFN